MPIPKIARNARGSMRSRFTENRHAVLSRDSTINSTTADTALEIDVAIATPSTDIRHTSTKKKFSPTLRSPVAVSTSNGVRVSPFARRMAMQ